MIYTHHMYDKSIVYIDNGDLVSWETRNNMNVDCNIMIDDYKERKKDKAKI